MRRTVKAVLLLLTILTGLRAADKTELRITLLDARSGKPYVGRDVQIFGTNATSGLQASDLVFHLQTKTDANGSAHFDISAPLPLRFIFYSAQADCCGPCTDFITEEVVRTGRVIPNMCARKNQKYRGQQVTAQPGEVVIFAVNPRGP
jgi:hypothetical protein